MRGEAGDTYEENAGKAELEQEDEEYACAVQIISDSSEQSSFVGPLSDQACLHLWQRRLARN
eukprot:5141195-Pyramimonas_sp.AAC.1